MHCPELGRRAGSSRAHARHGVIAPRCTFSPQTGAPAAGAGWLRTVPCRCCSVCPWHSRGLALGTGSVIPCMCVRATGGQRGLRVGVQHRVGGRMGRVPASARGERMGLRWCWGDVAGLLITPSQFGWRNAPVPHRLLTDAMLGKENFCAELRHVPRGGRTVLQRGLRSPRS